MLLSCPFFSKIISCAGVIFRRYSGANSWVSGFNWCFCVCFFLGINVKSLKNKEKVSWPGCCMPSIGAPAPLLVISWSLVGHFERKR